MELEALRLQRDTEIKGGDFRGALTKAESIIEAHRKELCFEDWFALGLCLFMVDRNADSVRAYERALSIEPANAQALANVAICWLALEKPKKAMQAFRQAFAVNPEIGPAWFQLGRYFMGRHAGGERASRKLAVNALRRAVRLSPACADFRVYDPLEDGLVSIDYLLGASGSVGDMTTDEFLDRAWNTVTTGSPREQSLGA